MMKTISILVVWLLSLIVLVANVIALIGGKDYIPYATNGLSILMFVVVSAVLHTHLKQENDNTLPH